MRKGTAGAKFGTIALNLKSLDNLKIWVTNTSRWRDWQWTDTMYIEPHFLVLIPFKEFSPESVDKGIYEPIESELLLQW